MKNKNRNNLAVVILFIVAVIMHYFLSDYLKTILVLPDESLYYSIAQSLWHGNGITVANAPYDFQKILYSILIMPTFAIENTVVRLHAIALINSIVVCSGIFPVYLLAKKYLRKNQHIIYTCVLYCVFSDLMFANTFMADTLYLPMGLLAIYFSSITFDQTEKYLFNKEIQKPNYKYYLNGLLLGIYFYFVFFCKEVGVVFQLTYCLMMIALYIKAERMGKNKQHQCGLLHMISVSVGFGLMYLLFKVCFFFYWHRWIQCIGE